LDQGAFPDALAAAPQTEEGAVVIGPLLRLFGYDLVPKKGRARHWRDVVQMLGRHGVDVVFDVGANTGQYVGYLRNAGYAGRIVSFEPLADAHAEISRMAERDANWIVAPRMALGAQRGEAVLNVSNESDMSSILPITETALETSPTSRTVAQERVPTATLAGIFDEYCGPGETAFVKVDTQGYEMPVVDGAEPVLDRIAGWQLELSIVEIYEGEPDWHAVTAAIEERGYALHYIIPGYYNRHIGRMMQYDGVFFREG
jgi:FkbM family methyltransferase